MKTKYKEGDKVIFDLDGNIKGEGVIRGLSSSNIVDFWIVEITKSENLADYPYSCATISSASLKKKDECEYCYDKGIVYIEHPVRPGVPMMEKPCPKCSNKII